MFSTFNDLIDALKKLASVEPQDNFEYLNQERLSFDISQFIRIQSYGNTCPDDIWHYLTDCDIRYKDKTYGKYQTALFLSAIEEWVQLSLELTSAMGR